MDNSSLCEQQYHRMVYYIDDQPTPYLTKLYVNQQSITLGMVKQSLGKNSFASNRYFFKSIDPDIGEVKEEISDDLDEVPLVDGKIVCWIKNDSSASETQQRRREDSVSITPSSRTNANTMRRRMRRNETVLVRGPFFYQTLPLPPRF
ncbi:hypothetical protein ACOME3_000608 [Neoechinorhynchus agilis]